MSFLKALGERSAWRRVAGKQRVTPGAKYSGARTAEALIACCETVCDRLEGQPESGTAFSATHFALRVCGEVA